MKHPDSHENEIVHRNLDTDRDTPAAELAEIVATLEEKDPDEVATTWDCIDGILGHVFSDPPSPEAQITVTFSYEGYRITIEQNGSAEFVKAT